MSRSAILWTVLVIACLTYMRNSSPSPTPTTGQAAPPRHTRPAAEVPWAHIHPSMPTLRASGMAILSDQIPSNGNPYTTFNCLHLTSSFSSLRSHHHLHPHGDGLDDLMHNPEFIFAQHFSGPVIGIHIRHGKRRCKKAGGIILRTTTLFLVDPLAHFARFITLFDTQVGRFWHCKSTAFLRCIVLCIRSLQHQPQLRLLQRLGAVRGLDDWKEGSTKSRLKTRMELAVCCCVVLAAAVKVFDSSIMLMEWKRLISYYSFICIT